jgi:nucleoside-diphosphate-sugar epimerase
MGNKVLITGGEGFIGSHVVEELIYRGYEPVIYDTFSNPHQDVRNLRILKQYMSDVDFCLHLAANPYIPFGYTHPNEFFDINATGTLNVLEAARENEVRIVYISTSEVYGTSQDPFKPMDENHRIHPHSTYALAKYAGDGLCFTYYKEHDVDVTIVRQFNCFGPRETWRYVIPEIIEQLHKSNILHLGNIYAERDFTYVADCARALVDVMECNGLEGEVLNCGSGETHSIQNIAFTLGEIMRAGEEVAIKVDDWRLRPYDVDRLLCDNSKIRRLTGWSPETEFYNGLVETVKFFRGNGNKWDYRTVYK